MGKVHRAVCSWLTRVGHAAPLCAASVTFLADPAGAQTAEAVAVRFLGSRHIAVAAEGMTETSGLALAADGRHLWTVSDNVGRVFLMDMNGDLKPAHSVDVGLSGLEGVALDSKRNRLLSVREETMDIVAVSLGDGGVQTFPLRAMEGFEAIAAPFSEGDPNDGLEGITLDPVTGMIFVLKEKAPRMLIGIAPDLTRIEATTVLGAELGFVSPDAPDADLDVAGLDYDPARKAFWIVSDTGEAVYLFDPANLPARGWSLSHGKHRVRNPEGIALAESGTQLVIVTDDGGESRLLTYAIEGH